LHIALLQVFDRLLGGFYSLGIMPCAHLSPFARGFQRLDARIDMGFGFALGYFRIWLRITYRSKTCQFLKTWQVYPPTKKLISAKCLRSGSGMLQGFYKIANSERAV
jgi:hypothetical protein